MAGHEVEGVVQSRTWGKLHQPAPSETEVLALNPNRERRLKQAMRWDRLEPGSLNLLVDEGLIQAVLPGCEPEFFERPEDVTYPPGRGDRVPQLRSGYLYYRANLQHLGRQCDVLLRRSVNPIHGRAELFADLNLRTRFDLKDGDRITVRLTIEAER